MTRRSAALRIDRRVSVGAVADVSLGGIAAGTALIVACWWGQVVAGWETTSACVTNATNGATLSRRDLGSVARARALRTIGTA